MGAFYTRALALVPKLVHHTKTRVAERPPLHIVEARPAYAPRHHVLSCHWERAQDGSMAAHWVSRDADAQPCPSQANPAPDLFDGMSRALIEDAYHYKRHGSMFSLIAVSRLSRLNQARQTRPGLSAATIFNLAASDCEAGPPHDPRP